MVLLFFLLTVATGHPTVALFDIIVNSAESLQIISMFRFFGLDSHENTPEVFRRHISDCSISVYGRASGVSTDTLGYVYGQRVLRMHVEWVIRSTTVCWIYGQRVSAPNLTICLPPKLEKLCVVECGVHGTLDPKCLPMQMISVDLEENIRQRAGSLPPCHA